ncbi:MAG: glycosyltransferase family 2 protein [Acidobacteriota bacterium]
MKLSVILPVYNEEPTVRQCVERTLSLPLDLEVVVVNDGSTDGTRRILESMDCQPRLRVVHAERNGGKGTAIRIGLQHVTGDIVIIQDADLEYDCNEYSNMLVPFQDPETSVVYGSRFLGRIEQMRLINRIANRFFTWFANVLFRANITDEATCYKAFRTDLLKDLDLRCRRFEFCPEVTAKVLRRHIPIKEVPITYRARTHEEGKKIGWRDGWMVIYTLLRYRLSR